MQYRGFTLDPFQEASIRHLMAGESVLVSAPTGNGKTIIADWVVEEALRQGKQVVYTAPVKALSNQKFRDYVRLYGEERVGLVTGDLVIRPDAPCRVMTTEILRNMLLGGQTVPNLLAVVIDEIHFLDDEERGTVWEEVLIYLPREVQIVGLSATLPNLEDFAAWLTWVREGPVHVVRAEERIVPLTIHYACKELGIQSPESYQERWQKQQAGGGGPPSRRDRRGRGRGGDRSDPQARGGNSQRDRGPGKRARSTRDTDLFRMMREKGYFPYLYFVFSRKDTESFARGLSRYVSGSLLDWEELEQIRPRLRAAARELGPALDPDLQKMYEQGIAYHHAGLHVALKALVEELYEDKLIKVLYCTSTFALGINMPARAVAFDGLMKYNGKNVAPLTTRGFMQKAGRAGRRGLDNHGHVVVRMELDEYSELKPVLKRYLEQSYEPVRSSFSLSWNSIVNLLERLDEQRIREVIGKSFLSWWLARKAEDQRRQAEHLEELADEQHRGGHKHRKEAHRLRRHAARAGSAAWDDFLAKIAFLERCGYIEADRSFNAGARILRNLQIEEIFVTEIVLSGELDMLEPATLFGVLCALTNELSRGVDRYYKITREDRRVIGPISNIRESWVVTEAEEIAGNTVTWDPNLMPLGRAWAEGRSLHEILGMVSSRTDMSGDLITGFRRAKDLAKQLRDVWREDSDKAEMVSALIRSVSRDEVEVLD